MDNIQSYVKIEGPKGDQLEHNSGYSIVRTERRPIEFLRTDSPKNQYHIFGSRRTERRMGMKCEKLKGDTKL